MMTLARHCFFIRLASCMLASGSDDGTFSIRDLRLLKVRLVGIPMSVKLGSMKLF